jgi:hypothetical protein
VSLLLFTPLLVNFSGFLVPFEQPLEFRGQTHTNLPVTSKVTDSYQKAKKSIQSRPKPASIATPSRARTTLVRECASPRKVKLARFPNADPVERIK